MRVTGLNINTEYSGLTVLIDTIQIQTRATSKMRPTMDREIQTKMNNPDQFTRQLFGGLSLTGIL